MENHATSIYFSLGFFKVDFKNSFPGCSCTLYYSNTNKIIIDPKFNQLFQIILPLISKNIFNQNIYLNKQISYCSSRPIQILIVNIIMVAST